MNKERGTRVISRRKLLIGAAAGGALAALGAYALSSAEQRKEDQGKTKSGFEKVNEEQSGYHLKSKAIK